uniref:Uncharacterized protein n=1 Tax=Haptolina brevifila TaxID=156173 RepID=A0A7S2IU82_9EUKA|mmetsp:Transcript_71134/g.141031  ORF Transcript_71134/g.141031 Transcript_71134/m.141031 type:complete len:427 (+) Transcript_71134:102-1382(+)
MSTDAAGQAAKPIGDHFHNGLGSAGNKSFLSYRLGYGVPGYTGFVPMHENIDIPTKTGCAERAPLDRGRAPHGNGGAVVDPASTVKADFSLSVAEFAEGTAPNPLWDTKAPRPIGDPPYIRRPPDTMDRKFIATSTFQNGYGTGLEGHQQAYPSDVTATGQLRPPGAEHPPDAGPFYTTEYMQKSEEGNLMMATKKVLPPGPEPKQRANRQISGVNLRHPALTTSYRTSYGAFGVEPRSNLPATPSEINFTASTAEYFQGTTKATHHPPGYSGFIPETGRNAHATAHGVCQGPRQGTKAFELQTLFQYPHHLPGYAGYHPQTAINDRGPVRDESLTTSGRDNIKGSSGFQPGELGLSMSTLAATAPQRSQFGKTGSLNKNAFSHESMTGALSDNGRHDAEMYYRTVRPMEGRSVAIIKQGHWNQLY